MNSVDIIQYFHVQTNGPGTLGNKNLQQANLAPLSGICHIVYKTNSQRNNCYKSDDIVMETQAHVCLCVCWGVGVDVCRVCTNSNWEEI